MRRETTAPTIDEIIGKINAEVARRRGMSGSSVALEPITLFPSPAPNGQAAIVVSARWRDRRNFSVTEFSTLSETEFVPTAYMAVLGREPDAEGQRHYIAHLRAGSMSRADVLLALLSSPEGRRRGTVVTGLGRARVLGRISRVRFIGRITRWLRTLARVHTLFAEQRRIASAQESVEIQNGRLAYEMGALREQVVALHRDVALHQSEEPITLSSIVTDDSAAHLDLDMRMQALHADQTDQAELIAMLRQEIEDLRRRLPPDDMD